MSGAAGCTAVPRARLILGSVGWCPESASRFPGVEIHIRRGQRGSFGLRRLPVDEVNRHVSNRLALAARLAVASGPFGSTFRSRHDITQFCP